MAHVDDETILLFDCPNCDTELTVDLPGEVRCPMCGELLCVVDASCPPEPTFDCPPEILAAFQEIGLEPSGEMGTVVRQYHTRVRSLHPDMNGGLEVRDGTELRKLNAAYRALRHFLSGSQ